MTLSRSKFHFQTSKQSRHIHHQSKKRNTNRNYFDSLLSDMGLHPASLATNETVSSSSSYSRKEAVGRSTFAASHHDDVQTSPKSCSQSVSSHRFPKITVKTQLDYARNGHAVLRNFINENTAPNIRLGEIRHSIQELTVEKELQAWRQKVQVAASNTDELSSLYDSRTCATIQQCQDALRAMGVTASLPFLQYFNTWRTVEQVRGLAFALGEAASILMDVPTVRLYQDAVFWKRLNDGPTPWHVDARMAPFDTAHMITFWIPLDRIPAKGGTALTFCSKSHADFALPYWNPVASQSDDDEWDRLAHRYPKRLIDYMPMFVGDVTVHSGWTLHCSDGNEQGLEDRIALAISYVDGHAEIRPGWETIGDNEDRWSYMEWCKSLTPRSSIHHDMVPIVWPPQ
jgi:Phytanoyl-CoA dioxygenase (PhyH)